MGLCFEIVTGLRAGNVGLTKTRRNGCWSDVGDRCHLRLTEAGPSLRLCAIGAIGAGMSDPTKVSRRLVAVFAADVEGYSRLMGADEVGTLRGLTERRAILDRLIADHGGRIANTAGDSILAEFGSAVDAVQCAVDVADCLGRS